MMFKSIRTAALVTALFATAGTAFAADATAKYGSTAPAASAHRHIVITEKTKHVRVENGETVEFKINGTSFTWHFLTLHQETSFDLGKIAPAGALKQKVTVHVASNPLYRS
ncbi:MAG TPA: CzcE family metal-binding protein [Duganella sp.]|uniref:CzcE family metal-binding protein n=1 Tax=Duganella sp. TaxID=1904440 RepID=UPI002ED44B4F